MPTHWTTEQVLALSPDDKSTKNGKGLAQSSKWQTLGFTETVTWGECKGSGKKPYRTQIDLTEPAFRCSCPSRKFPCKHALGLFFLLTGQADAFVEASPPDWVQEWLDKRSQTSQAKAEKKKVATVDPTAQAKRTANREAKIQAGLADLDLWLRDLIRQGLATAQTQPYSFWDQPAARMVDAQAPGLARRLREMSGIVHRGTPNWPQELFAELGKLHLLIQGYQRIETLPSPVQAELRSQMGWTLKQEELLAQVDQTPTEIEVVRDRWFILGKSVTEEENLLAQRVWLQSRQGRRALILSFAYGSNPLDTSLLPGATVDAELVFYPGLSPLRAVVKQKQPSTPSTPFDYSSTIAEAIASYGTAIAQNPWLSNFPVLLQDVIPYHQDDGWRLIDSEGTQLLLSQNFSTPWELLAQSGGHPISLFGEWNGQQLLPLSFWVDNNFMIC